MKKRIRTIGIYFILAVLLLSMLPVAFASVPEPMAVGRIVDISVGQGTFSDVGAVVTESGNLYMWGDNTYAQIGVAPTTTQEGNTTHYIENSSFSTPVLVDSIKNVVSIELGVGVCAALTSDGSVYTWGNNWYENTERFSGLLGHGTTEALIATPKKVEALNGKNVVQISVSESSFAALTSSGEVYIWGVTRDMATSGAAGLGSKVPYQPMCLDNVNVALTDAGAYAVITQNGELFHFPKGMSSIYPAYLPDYSIAKDVSFFSQCGNIGSAFVTTNGVIMAKPANAGGFEAVALPTSNKAITVNASSFYFAAVTVSGEVFTWGKSNTPLGIGKPAGGQVKEVVPTKVGLANIMQVSLGKDMALAQTTTGDVYVWGKIDGFTTYYEPIQLFNGTSTKPIIVNSYFYANENNVPILSTPYSKSRELIRQLSLGEEIFLVEAQYNSHGSLWYLTNDGGYVYSQNVTDRKPNTDRVKIFEFNNESYQVVYGFSEEYCYAQTDSRWNSEFSPNGSNLGCVVTAEAIAVSMYRQKIFLPTEMSYTREKIYCQWAFSKVVDAEYKKKSLDRATSEMQQLLTLYSLIHEGIPVNFRLKSVSISEANTESGHSVVVVGIRLYANPNALQIRDILVVDPWDGKLYTLETLLNDTKREIHCGTNWDMRIPTKG